ncbi:PQQ-dependent sugar dehydrogenase [Shimia thalassica]|uniref:PQQ-dependent sugar dehydrogenase n=1 Tax=Shimia thalassica TaxID=1715693 RepID=UPI001C09982B|nr:PQQ-dependent sugar dehydrogenase [Shimia thalassica]MBU2941599.1 PQQ-dependent sugar dehydrogenase [Shimia thalassica]MDO6504020.1 PQQ-dependent sugar dehydrogenase [Shimia thalassica]
MLRLLLVICVWLLPVVVQAQVISSQKGALTLTKMADGFRTPWALAFLPDGSFLVTEREGKLWQVTHQGKKRQIKGLPNVAVQNQGGLLDVMVPRDFENRRELFLSYSKKQGGGAGTAVARATLKANSNRLSDVRQIFEMTPGSKGGRHFGSRIVEARDGTLFVTVGERGDRPSAQDLGRHNGSIIRITRTGAVPADNPFVSNAAAQPEIWSYGHRNPQGAALDRNGNLWAVEHGAKGGDEVNRIRVGRNYGWPVISYGTHYSGAKIGEGTSKSGLEQPKFFWDPSIAPSGLMIYSGKLWPEWRGNMFVGSLKFDFISRLSGSKLSERERLKSDETARVRDIREAPDGAIWFIAEDKGAIFRISPRD